MSYKRFSLITFFIISVFFVYNILSWNFFTKKLNHFNVDNVTYIIGDLARVGYISDEGLHQVRTIKNNFQSRHVDIKNYNFEAVDFMTIGDSFSNGGGNGKNPFYQDYLVNKLNVKVLNLRQYPTTINYIETIYLLGNSGFLEKSKTKYIVLEMIQRDFFTNFIKPIDKNININSIDILKKYKKTENIYENVHKLKENTQFRISDYLNINNGNFKSVFFPLLYNFSEKAYFSKVHMVKLEKEFFSSDVADTLLYYGDDIKSIKRNTQNNLSLINEILNDLSKYLEKKDIKLIVMPGPNKYDVYSKYIINNKYPLDNFFSIFQKLKKNYIFVDTQKILEKELANNVIDLYYVDDTHWSYKASEAVVNALNQAIKENPSNAL